MTWQPHQQIRLATEWHLLREHLPDFEFFDRTGRTYVLGKWRSPKGYVYTIRIDLPRGYPDECPKTYIVAPSPLLDHYGKHMTRHGASHSYHTWRSDRPGFVQVCTYRPEYWDSASTLIQLVHKSFLWLIAYDEHRATGKQISDLLLTMDAR